jgi:hypothetical protein
MCRDKLIRPPQPSDADQTTTGDRDIADSGHDVSPDRGKEFVES